MCLRVFKYSIMDEEQASENATVNRAADNYKHEYI